MTGAKVRSSAAIGQRPPAGERWEIRTDPLLSANIDAAHRAYAALDRPGAIVAVLRGDEVVHFAGYGLANVEFEVPWTPDVRYTFFSLTKPMVACALLALETTGALSLQAEVADILPGFPRFAWPVRVEHLLTHTSGLWQDETVARLLRLAWPSPPITLDELYALSVRQRDLPFRPGTCFYYNDAGMRIAARVLERAAGLGFAEAMAALVFAPAGMTSASLSAAEPARLSRQASSYWPADAAGARYLVASVPFESSGDGAVVGTIGDLVAFARYLAAERPSGRLVDRLGAPVAYRPGLHGSYRTCLRERFHRGVAFLEHGGLFGKTLAYVPALDAWLIVMRNALDLARLSEAGHLRLLLDALLDTRPDTRARLSPGHPDHSGAFPKPPLQDFNPQFLEAVAGDYVEPISRFPLRLTPCEGRLCFEFLGVADELVRGSAANCLRTNPGSLGPLIEIACAADEVGWRLSLRHSDWETFRPIARAAPGAPADGEALVGLYRSSELGAVLVVETESDGGLALLLDRLDAAAAGRLSAFEGMSRNAMAAALEHVPGLRNPFGRDPLPDYAILVELHGGPDEASTLDARLEGLAEAAAAEGLICDARFGPSAHVWRLRHAISEGLSRSGAVIGFDVALPVAAAAAFRRDVEARLLPRFTEFVCCDFGHWGGRRRALQLRAPRRSEPARRRRGGAARCRAGRRRAPQRRL